MSTRFEAFGTTLAYTNEGSPVLVAGLTNFSAPNMDTEELDGTAHDSPDRHREIIPGLSDSGEVSLEGFYDPTHESHDGAGGLPELYETKEIKDWTITLVNVADSPHPTITFKGWVKAFQTTFPVGELMGFTATIRVKGKTGYPELNQ